MGVRGLFVLVSTTALAGCAVSMAPVVTPATAPAASLPVASAPPAVAGTPVRLELDRLGQLVADAERAYDEGRADVVAGRLESARASFDYAIDVLLSEPGGAKADARVNAAYRSLLDRISAVEAVALADVGGAVDPEAEPAAIDDLLAAAATFERPAPAATTAETVAADLERDPTALPIPLNDRVLSFVELFQGRLREFMQAGLNRGQRYLPMIQAVFRAEGLPEELGYVPLVESAFKLTALSRASARGMWQFMQATGREFGLEQNWYVDERADPEKATRAAARYLKSLNSFFDDWHIALASYNAGPGRLQRAMRQSRQDDYWTLTSSSRYLPRETRDYVPMILAAAVIARNPTLYGFEVNAAAPLTYERVSVPDALKLEIIAEWASVPVETLQELNPELRRLSTPATAYALKVPVGTAATIEARLATADPDIFVRFEQHVVRRGETLSRIAQKYGLSVSELMQANQMRSTRLSVNQTLVLPIRAGAPGSRTAGASTSRSTAKPAVARSPVSGRAPVVHRVRSGDTLGSIARRYATTVAEIKRLNRLTSDRLSIGQRLTVKR